MRKKLPFLTFLLISLSLLQAQGITVNTSIGAEYANQVFYKLSTQTESSFEAKKWDIAFLRTSAFSLSLRVNDAIDTQVYEASNNSADWNTIDVANEENWTKLYNSDTSWSPGAFDNGSATYGWGEYNIATHVVTGSVIFVLKDLEGNYIKFFNESYSNGYTFKYSKWNIETSTWSEDKTATVLNSSNPNNTFNYYSLQNEEELVAEPATTDWDLKFTKYYTDYYGDGSLYYGVTGVLQNEGVEVAKNIESSGVETNPSLTYSEDINTIGYDWKSFNFTTYAYDISSENIYYVKDVDENIFRLYFTSFGGSSTGDISFNFENVTTSLDFEEISESVSFGVYPNPTLDKKINLVYDVNSLDSNENNISIYAVSGQKVFDQVLTNTSGFYNKNLDLSTLDNGLYILVFTTGTKSVSKRIILK